MKIYCYFVSYFYNDNNVNGFGNFTIDFNKKIDSINNYIEFTNFVIENFKKENNIDITILNWKELM
jgi:hypothetical protein